MLKKHFRSNWIVTLILTFTLMGFSHSAAADEDSPYITIKRMTMETANAVALTAVLACREQGVQSSATVVDKNGTVQAVVRDTLAPPVSITVSRLKAYTAANFSVATSGLERQASSSLANVPGLMMGAGGPFTWEKFQRFMDQHPLPRPVVYVSLFDR